jgi:DNA-binding PadR family transcriptional regulator
MKPKSTSDREIPRLTSRELLIMEILVADPARELYGLELVRESDNRLKQGTVYVTLSRLENKGFIESRENKQPNISGLPRKLYRVTGYGRRVHDILLQAQKLGRFRPVTQESAL